MALSQPVRDLISLKSLIKEVIKNLVINSKELKVVSSLTVYEYNNGAVVLEKSPSMTPISNYITVKYNESRQNIVSDLCSKILSLRIIRQIFSSKFHKVDYLSVLGSFYAVINTP